MTYAHDKAIEAVRKMDSKFKPQTQWQQFILDLKRTFVSEEQEKTRNAMKWWAANGCLSSDVMHMRKQ